MNAAIRKIFTISEDVIEEAGRPVGSVCRRAAAVAVIHNPWHRRGFVHDLQPEVREVAPVLAIELSTRLTDVLGGRTAIQAFGKAAIVGLNGEMEHGAAFIHTPYFGNLFRELVDGSSIIVFSDDRLAAGGSISVPMWHKTAAATRSHYQTLHVRIPDAPHPDELVIVLAGSTTGRPHPRIGDRSTDAVITLASALQR